jgi:[FeFe] hydrogenase H-cluster maturation GTPase HydF
VEKTMELLPVGPVVFFDTAGVDDNSELSGKRLQKTMAVFSRADVAVLITEPGIFGDYEEVIAKEALNRNTPLIVVVNKCDISCPSETFMDGLRKRFKQVCCSGSHDIKERDKVINEFKRLIIDISPEDLLRPPALMGDLIPPGGTAVLVVPIDLQAPKGRLILPQVQAIRDCLDSDGMVLVVKERELSHALLRLSSVPDIVVCDSQVVMKTVADTPENVKCTTFSILMARYKGSLIDSVKGVKAIDSLKSGDKVLIAESCSHHPIEDDIGRVKIPRWLKQYTGVDLDIRVSSGRDFPPDLSEYKLIVHCGGCMMNRKEMLSRVQLARESKVPITNYGVAISYLQVSWTGCLPRSRPRGRY